MTTPHVIINSPNLTTLGSWATGSIGTMGSWDPAEIQLGSRYRATVAIRKQETQ